MRKTKTVILALVLAIIVAIPSITIARPLDEVPQRTENDVVYVPLRQTAYAHGAIVDWHGETRTVYVTFANGETWSFSVDDLVSEIGGFIEPPGVTWIPLDFAVQRFAATLTYEVIVTNFMERFAIRDIVGATLMMSAEMQQAFDLNMGILVPHGDIEGFVVIDASYVPGFHVFDVAATHVMGEAVYNIAVNDMGEIAGLGIDFIFEPMLPPVNATYTAETIILGVGTAWPLDGILTLPENASADNPVPAVILVHGSGAQNMDLSLFNNRPFFDIADYLSSNGIAVLRYNKRTFTHRTAFGQAFGSNVTVWEESIEDALLAVELLRADERIGSVFVAGFSLGAMLAPRIMEEGNLDGAIMMGGSPRRLYEISYDQNMQVITDALNDLPDLIAAGVISQEEADAILTANLDIIASALEEARNMPNMTEAELAEAVIFGMPAIYQLSIVESLPQIFMARNTTPVLILHGDRDFQVFTEQDFNVLVSYTQGMAHVQSILYNNVNHMFMQSQTSYNDIRDYMPTDRVYEQVLRDILAWINSIVNQ
ncbi:MAG: stalk domain-containing protein [Defluviitaleaceae bacterium]|nr:stalk domain-containing protein [Defluviitaleaceae bacterium]